MVVVVEEVGEVEVVAMVVMVVVVVVVVVVVEEEEEEKEKEEVVEEAVKAAQQLYQQRQDCAPRAQHQWLRSVRSKLRSGVTASVAGGIVQRSLCSGTVR